MSRQLYELVGTETDRPFSPYCWRTRMALAHKGLDTDSVPWRFTEKEAISKHKSEKVPVLIDGEHTISDSWAIANYLEDAYPDCRAELCRLHRVRRIPVGAGNEPVPAAGN